ncbi:hypothetical protein [Fimbriiglobus ruber]|uniref:Uncharacterized protein n=1 Tax=Fimbriiglobus ruber TaxID=1908690 RepID=A0A225DZQ1_9BACT|nr:hypothetical protein [Fimbriiglobus ruber]OWK44018.1 hypothetical protein FRUB_03617 [Fimbriiglobus ruber]
MTEAEIRQSLQDLLSKHFKRPLTQVEQDALFTATVKGNPKFDPEAKALFERFAKTSADVMDEVKREFKQSGESGRWFSPPGSKETDPKIWLEGQQQVGNTAEHNKTMLQAAATALEEKGTVAVFMDRNLTTALEWLEKQPGISEIQRAELVSTRIRLNAVTIPKDATKAQLRQIPVKQPDVVVIRKIGTAEKPQYKIDITEVISPNSQTEKELRDRINKAFELLPSEIRGDGLAIPPAPNPPAPN